MCTEKGAELGLMHIVKERCKITILEGRGIKNNTDAPAIKQKDLSETGKKRGGDRCGQVDDEDGGRGRSWRMGWVPT